MRRLKVLVLLVLALTATTASTGTAEAANLTAWSENYPYTGEFHAVSEGHLRIPSYVGDIECNWTFKGRVWEHGAGIAVETKLHQIYIEGCTNGWSAKVVYIETPLTILPLRGGPDGTVTWKNATITFTRWSLGMEQSCSYVINTDLGRLTGSTTTGGEPTLDVLAKIELEKGNWFCEVKPTLSGSFKFTDPNVLDVDGPDTFHAASEGKVTIEGSTGWKNECDVTFESEVKADGSNITDGGGITYPVISGCEKGASATVTTPGTLKIHPIAGGPDGTVTWSGASFTIVKEGISCTYTSSGTDIGRLTGSTTTGETATIDLSGSLTASGSFLCGKTGALTGSLTVTYPDALNVTS